MPISRRHLLGASAAALAVPRLGRAAAAPEDRRFIFIFANGGWDLSWGLVPLFDNARVDSPTDGSAPATAGELSFVDGPDRPAVAAWFRRWSDRTCMIHGFEVRSVAHLNCRRLLFTGESGATSDDWPTLIAAHGAGPDAALPHLIVSGPGFSATHPELVARVGADGQLGALLDLGMLARADVRHAPLSAQSQDAVAAHLAARSESLTGAAATPAAKALHTRLAEQRTRLPDLEAALASTNISAAVEFPDQVRLAADVIAGGISRCVLVKHNGFNQMTWDDHGGIEGQALHHQDLFEGLSVLTEDLASRPGLVGDTLLDDTTVVVMSEMSRHPQLNGTRGKDHWTWTSAMLLGAGVAGGQMVGGYDDDVFGLPIDPVSGALSSSGIQLQARHLGATLLALAGIDPTPHFNVDTPVIEAALS